MSSLFIAALANLIAAPAYFCVLNKLDANCLIPSQEISSVPVHFG